MTDRTGVKGHLMAFRDHKGASMLGQFTEKLERRAIAHRNRDYVGSIDAVRDGYVLGWVARRDGASPAPLRLFANGECAVERIPASNPRPDIEHIAGAIGFSIPIPWLAIADEVRFEIRSATKTDHLFLQRTFDLTDPELSIWECGFETVTADRVVGWLNADVHGNDILLDIKSGAKLLASGVRLSSKGKTNGISRVVKFSHVFSSDLRLEPGDRIQVLASGTHIVLLDSEVEPKPRGSAAEPSVSFYKLRVDNTGDGVIRGWSAHQIDIGRIFKFDVYLNGIFLRSVDNADRRDDLKRHKLTRGLGGFKFKIHRSLLINGKNKLVFKLPNGETRTETFEHNGSQAGRLVMPVAQPRPVSIVIPVYNALEDVKNCIASVLRNTRGRNVSLLVIDDASPDKEVWIYLKGMDRPSNMRVIRNSENLGFTRTINRGIRESGDDDVVILNSDTWVGVGWLNGLVDAATSHARVGTVTAMSDRAGAFSAPDIGNDNPLPPGVSRENYARAFKRQSARCYPVVPTGNGFCMFIKRELIQQIGPLDAAAFPRGYGEENDFCMRAQRAGWMNVVDDATYVYHERSKSFGDEKHQLMRDGRTVIDSRYPEYSVLTGVYSSDELIGVARYNARVAQSSCTDAVRNLPRILFILSTQSGGTPQTNADLMKVLHGTAECWLLYSDASKVTLQRQTTDGGKLVEVDSFHLDVPVSHITHMSHEYDDKISALLRRFQFDFVHVRHLAWHSLNLIKISSELGIPTVFSFHDYYTLCPTVKLLDSNNTFCGGVCTAVKNDCRPELWDNARFPRLNNGWVNQWRDMFGEALAHADGYVTTSEGAMNTIARNFQIEAIDEKAAIIPHGRDLNYLPVELKTPTTKLKILAPGNISDAKGAQLIAALLEIDKDERLEFHILGRFENEFQHPRLYKHGRYKRQNFAELSKKIGANIGAVFSIWDETWCHTLTELWSVGLPVAALDFSVVATRINEFEAGWVFGKGNVEQLYRDLVDNCLNDDSYVEKLKGVLNWQRNEGSYRSTRFMAAQYWQVYQQARSRKLEAEQAFEGTPTSLNLKPIIAVVSPCQPSFKAANASTHIRVWERTHNHFDRDFCFVRMSPTELIAAAKAGAIERAIIQRNAIQKSDWEELKPLVESSALRFVLDLDDNLLEVPADKDPDLVYQNYHSTLKQIISSADLLSLSTDTVRNDLAKAIGETNTAIVPNYLSERVWSGFASDREEDGAIRAVYFGSRTHDSDLKLVLEPLSRIAKKYPNFELVLVGIASDDIADQYDWITSVPVPPDCRNYPEFVKWLSSAATEFDFAIAPLDMRQKFNRSKSSLKALEASGLGLPCLVSAGVVFDDTAEQLSECITVRNSNGEWFHEVDNLIQRIGETSGLRNAIKSEVLEKFGLSQRESSFDDLLKTAFSEA